MCVNLDFTINKYVKNNKYEHIYKITKNGEEGILVLKLIFIDIPELQIILKNAEIVTENDRYYSIKIKRENESDIDAMIVFPASKEDWDKYLSRRVFKKETYEEFLSWYIKKLIPWIDNIIDNKDCNENVLFRDDQIIICIDSKWDGKNKSELYLLALFTNKISCIREVTEEMLIISKEKILKCLEENYNMKYEDVLLLIHYPPSFYSFHIHVVALTRDISYSVIAGRAIVVDDAIKNLHMDPNYYKKEMFSIMLD